MAKKPALEARPGHRLFESDGSIHGVVAGQPLRSTRGDFPRSARYIWRSGVRSPIPAGYAARK